MAEHRASFDAEVTFSNGGALKVESFRLDIPRSEITDDELAALIVRHLGLLMVAEVRLSNVQIIAEPHKGSRGVSTADTPTERRLVDLNHVIEAGMTTYPGLPGAVITPYNERGLFEIGKIEMLGNTGTYVDSPYHYYSDKADLAGLPLTSLADLPIVVFRLQDNTDRGIGPLTFAASEVAGAAVILHTGWDRHWRTEQYGHDAPFLTGPAARFLADSGVALVGIDSVNIDDMGDPTRPAHSTLLGAGIPILEHLTGLDQLPVTGARLHAAPPRIREFTSFPVRAYAVIGGGLPRAEA